MTMHSRLGPSVRLVRRLLLTAVGVAGASLIVVGCGSSSSEEDWDSDPKVLEPDDPEVENAEELWDDGPPPEEGPVVEEDPSLTSEDGELQLELSGRPGFQMPFPCGQTWSGQTRTNHSPMNAVDFNRTDDYGDPVSASAAGTVSKVGNTGSTSYGRWIEINHGNGWTTRYAHLSAQSVSVGQKVSRGQKIGNVGSTGGSSGPHLHFEERYNGTPVKVTMNGSYAYYFGTRSYKSNNCTTTSSSYPRGTVRTSGAALTVRSGPSTSYAAVGSVANGSTVTIKCQKKGQSITGTFGTSSLWDYIGSGYVSDAYIYTGTDGQVAATCQ
jgi:hypothetical protein